MRIFGRSALACGAAALLASTLFAMASPLDLALFVAAFAVFTAPGWPLSRWFAGAGRDWLSRLVLAFVLGYLSGALVTVALRAAGIVSPIACLAGCLALALALQRVIPRDAPGLVTLARFDGPDLAALGVLWLVTAAIVGPVFARVGEATPDGLAFRAYFIADLFAHMSVVGELAKGAVPPINPYLPAEPLPYYWSYFTLPALLTMLRPGPWLHHAILLTDIVAASLFVGVGYLVVRSVGASALASAASWSVLLLANSFEGLAYFQRAGLAGFAERTFRNVNVDGITRWYWSLPGVDGFQRLMWWTPQHEMAITMGLLVIALAILPRDRNSLQRGAADGLLLGGAVAFSSFNGILLVLSYAVLELAMLALARGRDFKRWFAARSLAAAIVLGALGLTVAVGMLQRTPGAFVFGWNRHFLRDPWRFLLYNFGPAPFLAPIAAFAVIRRPPLAVTLGSVVVVSAAAFLFFDIRGHENTYVVFRAAQLVFLVLAVMLALAIDRWRRWPRPVRVTLAGALVLGSLAAFPTVALDWHNARDITNLALNPGRFRWTIHLTPNEQVAATWIQRTLPQTAIVQTDARARGRGTWALVPAFFRRRMATGLGLFEPNPARFGPNMDAIHQMYSTADGDAAGDTCRRLGIEYVYVGPVERRANPAGIAKFGDRPDLFRPVFRLVDEEIFEVVQ
jgi:hypothetical protein